MRRIDAGAAFVATNRDATFPMEGGLFAPGAGTMVAAVATAVGREPDLVIGKPEPTLIAAAMNRFGALPSETLVVGDRRDTDIEAGRRAGCRTLLVLTGVATEPGEDRWLPGVADLTPEFVRHQLQ